MPDSLFTPPPTLCNGLVASDASAARFDCLSLDDVKRRRLHFLSTAMSISNRHRCR